MIFKHLHFMKKIYFTLVTFLFLAVANAQIVNIPDANFKAKLLAASPSNTIASTATPVYNFPNDTWTVSSYHKIDTNNDGEIQVSEAQTIKFLNVNFSSITNIAGIASFTNLIYLDCGDNQITILNEQGLTSLKALNCRFNQLSSLNVQGLTNLQSLNCSDNQLSSLNVQALTNLHTLSCIFNQLPSLNVQGLTNLKRLNSIGNQLPSLNVQGLTNLQSLDCSYNQLPSLNVQGLTSLKYLYCNSNQLPSLNVQGLTNLNNLVCTSNQLTSLNVQGLTNLIYLDCSNNQLTSLFIKNGNLQVWSPLRFYSNPNLAYICADEEDVALVQTKITEYGYTNCTVDSNCNLSVDTNLYDDNYFTIYPNPVNEVLNLNTKQATEVYSLTIYNLLGQQVQTTTNPTNTVDVSSLKTGNYIVKVVTDKGVSSSKFVKE